MSFYRPVLVGYAGVEGSFMEKSDEADGHGVESSQNTMNMACGNNEYSVEAQCPPRLGSAFCANTGGPRFEIAEFEREDRRLNRAEW